MCRRVDLVSLAFDIIQSTLREWDANEKRMCFFLLSLSKSGIFRAFREVQSSWSPRAISLMLVFWCASYWSAALCGNFIFLCRLYGGGADIRLALLRSGQEIFFYGPFWFFLWKFKIWTKISIEEKCCSSPHLIPAKASSADESRPSKSAASWSRSDGDPLASPRRFAYRRRAYPLNK